MENLIAKLLQDYEQGKMSRRGLIKSLAFAATAASAASLKPAAAAEGNVIKAVHLNHISYSVADYGKSRDWYADVFGMKVLKDDHKGLARLAVGDSEFVIRNRESASVPVPVIDHICFTIPDWENLRGCPESGACEVVKPEDWTSEWVKKTQNRFTIADWQNIKGGAGEELKRRNVKFKSANQVSFHILDPDGYEVQIGGVNQ
jgi:catechol 2,3-dioxygenase-like lactoylglutathione lyase family enzyme